MRNTKILASAMAGADTATMAAAIAAAASLRCFGVTKVSPDKRRRATMAPAAKRALESAEARAMAKSAAIPQDIGAAQHSALRRKRASSFFAGRKVMLAKQARLYGRCPNSILLFSSCSSNCLLKTGS